eukprot:60341_1
MTTARNDNKEEMSNISMPKGQGKYNNTQVGWLEKRSKFMKKWRARFCVLRMSNCLMITYKYEFDEVTNIKILNDKKNQTDSIIFGDISMVQEIDFDENGEEIEYHKVKDENKIIRSKEYFGFKVLINKEICNELILEKKRWNFKCKYEGFDLQTVTYQKKDFDSYIFRCKSRLATQYWIDLIGDCIIRAKYYNSINFKNNSFSLLPNDSDREIKYYRLLLGLPHNQNVTILWEKLGIALSQKEDKENDMNIFNSCCNAFET